MRELTFRASGTIKRGYSLLRLWYECEENPEVTMIWRIRLRGKRRATDAEFLFFVEGEKVWSYRQAVNWAEAAAIEEEYSFKDSGIRWKKDKERRSYRAEGEPRLSKVVMRETPRNRHTSGTTYYVDGRRVKNAGAVRGLLSLPSPLGADEVLRLRPGKRGRRIRGPGEPRKRDGWWEWPTFLQGEWVWEKRGKAS